jgi:hypothetical protein
MIGVRLLCERGAGSGDFESGEQELFSEFLNIEILLKIEILMVIFSKKLFLVKVGTYYHGCRRPFNQGCQNGRPTVKITVRTSISSGRLRPSAFTPRTSSVRADG